MLTLEQAWPWRTMEYWGEEEGKRVRWYHDRYKVTWEALGVLQAWEVVEEER